MLLLAYWADNFVYVIVIAGLVGGAVSSIQRIQSANLASSRALALARHSSLNLGVVISPLLGGIFAIVLALMLMSKTVTPGAVVPKVEMGPATNSPATIITSPTNTQSTTSATNLNPLVKRDEKAPPNTVAGAGRTETKNQPPQGFIYQFFSVSAIFAGGTDLALFMIWMFLAGFSERLVPDLLSKVAEQKKP